MEDIFSRIGDDDVAANGSSNSSSSSSSSGSRSIMTCIVKVSMLEIYQEQLNDLLTTYSGKNNHHSNSSSNSSSTSIGNQQQGLGLSTFLKDTSNKGLRIRENEDGLIWVENLREVVVKTSSEFMSVLSGMK
jgi:hypothetical protein